MTLLAILLLAIGLSFDTFAVSLSSGICLPQIKRSLFLKVISGFAIFQSGFVYCGWLLGISFLEYLSAADHWIAFALLSYIGFKMIYEGFKNMDRDEPCSDITNIRRLLIVSFATSIDAFAAGISLAMVDVPQSEILLIVVIVALVTALASAIGLKWGRYVGKRAGKKAVIMGGFILLFLGVKILVEHLDILS
jgi:manganese efflux pump family protein